MTTNTYINSLKESFIGVVKFVAFMVCNLIGIFSIFVLPIAVFSTQSFLESLGILFPFYIVLFFIHTTLYHFKIYEKIMF